ncbi:sensor histidine kinase [Marmoricola endophyticus]|uniref:histidine kinase n=1 Tax=Marmoricola endophyticus TaxID=2040280 RepID=A0A917BC69_9ACTN|nr:HAMP domain-containing sensor histidine kinase [Marmoricola endophyticus]GGF37004.1 sensor histidine kinase [Marmoricola endophyticus]
MRAHLRDRLPRTLAARLTMTVVGLVAVVLVLVALVTSLVMSRYLTSRLDQQLVDVAQRAARGGPSTGSGGDPGRGFGGEPPDGFRRPFSPGTLLAVIDDGSASGSSDSRSGVVPESGGPLDSVSRASMQRLADVSPGRPTTVSLDGRGDYRVLVLLTDGGSSDGALVAIGLPEDELDSSTHRLLLLSLLLALAGTLLAAGTATYLVRRQLRPLQQVAATAYDVTGLPLDSGDAVIETRVDARLTDETTEVGQVGSALNTLLDHVEDALSERHRSEQRVRQFVADASHELRTPLATIHGYAELSRRTPDDAAALDTAMRKVGTEATRMSALVEDLLLLARLDSGRPLESAEVDLTHLLLETVVDARVVAPDHDWRLELPDEPLTVAGDELRLHQVLGNLVGNARRHTPAGTTITVTALRDDTATVVRVHDDGPGLPDGLADRAFERFTRGDAGRTRDEAQGEGAGLGLSLVRAITEAHGGTVEVDSRPSDTTFTLRLP